jgi:hypothetical protein
LQGAAQDGLVVAGCHIAEEVAEDVRVMFVKSICSSNGCVSPASSLKQETLSHEKRVARQC